MLVEIIVPVLVVILNTPVLVITTAPVEELTLVPELAVMELTNTLLITKALVVAVVAVVADWNINWNVVVVAYTLPTIFVVVLEVLSANTLG